MNLILNALFLSLILFFSVFTGNFLLMWLYLAQQMVKPSGNFANIIDRSMAGMDNIAIPTGIF